MAKKYTGPIYEVQHTSPAVVLALDISSVCVGYAVFSGLDLGVHDKYLHIGKNHGEKLNNFYKWLVKTFRRFDPTHVVTEMPHGGHAGKAFAVLTMYLAVVYMAYFEVFGAEFPDNCKMYPSAIKSLLGVQPTKNHDTNKSVMVDFINQAFNLTLRFTKDPTKKTSDDDISDAIAVGVAWIKRSGRDDGRYDFNRDRSARSPKKASRRRS